MRDAKINAWYDVLIMQYSNYLLCTIPFCSTYFRIIMRYYIQILPGARISQDHMTLYNDPVETHGQWTIVEITYICELILLTSFVTWNGLTKRIVTNFQRYNKSRLTRKELISRKKVVFFSDTLYWYEIATRALCVMLGAVLKLITVICNENEAG
jgi:hypothetical protein